MEHPVIRARICDLPAIFVTLEEGAVPCIAVHHVIAFAGGRDNDRCRVHDVAQLPHLRHSGSGVVQDVELTITEAAHLEATDKVDDVCRFIESVRLVGRVRAVAVYRQGAA